MAISISDRSDFESKLIPHFIARDINQLDPRFAVFKIIERISARNEYFDNLIANLNLAGKASIQIDMLYINNHVLHKLSEFYRDKEVSLMIETFEIYYFDLDNLSNEDTEIINKINPKMLRIKKILQSVENIKALALINCINIDINFSGYFSITCFYFWFINTPVQHF